MPRINSSINLTYHPCINCRIISPLWVSNLLQYSNLIRLGTILVVYTYFGNCNCFTVDLLYSQAIDKATFEVFISIKAFECFKHLRGAEACVQNKIVKDICALHRRDDFLAKLCSGYAKGIDFNIRYLLQIPSLVTYYQLLRVFTQSNTTTTWILTSSHKVVITLVCFHTIFTV